MLCSTKLTHHDKLGISEVPRNCCKNRHSACSFQVRCFHYVLTQQLIQSMH